MGKVPGYRLVWPNISHVGSKAVHQAWRKPDEGTLLFITVDGD
jgi:hypothetical protein